MPNTNLQPGQSHTFKDTEGGSDLVVKNNSASEGHYTYANDSGPTHAHAIAPHASQPYEVADGQSATVHNTGTVPLEVEFADGVTAKRRK